MPRKLLAQSEDVIETYAPLIKEFILQGEADLGVHTKQKVPGFRAKLTHLKSYAYTQMGLYDNTTAGRVHAIIRRIELVWEPVSDAAAIPMVHVYWRPDQIMTARAAAGLPVTRVSEIEQATIAEAREWLLTNL